MHRARVSRLALVSLGLTALLSPRALADSAFSTSTSIWKAMDACNFQAQKAYPDYTRQGHEQREAYREACMRAGNLPYAGTSGGSPPAPFATQLQPRNEPPQVQQQQLMQQMRNSLER